MVKCESCLFGGTLLFFCHLYEENAKHTATIITEPQIKLFRGIFRCVNAYQRTKENITLFNAKLRPI